MQIVKNIGENPRDWLMEMENLVQHNVALMTDPSISGAFPDLYDSDIIYKRENLGSEYWQDAGELANSGSGDCEDLACYRAAQYRVRGIRANPAIKKIHGKQYHALVKMPDGSIEDPSGILIRKRGYHGRGSGKRGNKRIRKLKYGFRKILSGNCIGFVEIPALVQSSPVSAMQYQPIQAQGQGDNPLQALTSAIANTDTANKYGHVAVDAQNVVNFAQGLKAAYPQGNIPPDLMQTALNDPTLNNLAMSNPYSAVAMVLLRNPAIQQGLKSAGQKLKNKLRKWF